MRVSVTTLEKVDPNNNEDKFYRVYLIPQNSSAICQNGSQRHGRNGGTYRSWTIDEGRKKLHDKQRSGYTLVDEVDYEVAEAKFQVQAVKGDKVVGPWLEAQYSAARRGVPNPTGPVGPTVKDGADKFKAGQGGKPAPVSTAVGPYTNDLLGNLSAKLLDAISAAANDPKSALVAYAEVGEQFEEVDAEFRKLKSYRDTLETLVEDAL